MSRMSPRDLMQADEIVTLQLLEPSDAMARVHGQL